MTSFVKYKIIWLHYGVENAKWDTPILMNLQQKYSDLIQVIPLNVKELSSLSDLRQIFDKHNIGLAINRVSDAQNPTVTKWTMTILNYVEQVHKIEVLNGSLCYSIGMSKSLQGCILEESLLLGYPKTKIISLSSFHDHPTKEQSKHVQTAGLAVGFPLLIKPNAGGFGKGIQKVKTKLQWDNLFLSPSSESLNFSFISSFQHSNDFVLLLQKFHEDADFYRIWHLGGSVQFGIQVLSPNKTNSKIGEDFNSCVCKSSSSNTSSPLTFLWFEPDETIKEEISRITDACKAAMGSVEYLQHKQSGKRYYFDINMLSTLPHLDVIDFKDDQEKQKWKDPHRQVADYIWDQLNR